MSDVIVIGAGIVGATCAHELARRGQRVLMLDAGLRAATAAGMGHLIVLDDNPAELALSQYSVQRWRDWAREMPEDCAYRQNGTLWLAANAEEMAVAEAKYQVLREHGLDCELLGAGALRAAEPELRDGLHGGLRVGGDGILYAPNAARWLLDHPLIEQRRAQVIEVVKAGKLTAFLDMAYQGFADGITDDGAVVGKFVAAGLDVFVSTSFSKSFSLYGERVGALSVVCASKEEADKVLSQLKIMIRTNYSNPPTHGGAVVAMVLGDAKLRAQWEEELAGMRKRIKAMRQALVDGLKAAGVKQDMSFITTQVGMFSYSGLSKDQMVRLRDEFGVYGTDTGRMCVAALNEKNIGYVCESIAKVM